MGLVLWLMFGLGAAALAIIMKLTEYNFGEEITLDDIFGCGEMAYISIGLIAMGFVSFVAMIIIWFFYGMNLLYQKYKHEIVFKNPFYKKK